MKTIEPMINNSTDFSELMNKVAELTEEQKLKLSYFLQGYVAAAAGLNKKEE